MTSHCDITQNHVYNDVTQTCLSLSTCLSVYLSVSYFMDGRDPAQLLYRWNQVLDPSLKKGPWTKQEDEVGWGWG